MPTPGEWYSSLPPISKAWGTLLVGMTAATSLNLVSPMLLALSHPMVFGKLQVWRLLTCFFWAGPLGFGFVFELLMLVQCAVKLEQDIYDGRPADFLFAIIFGMIAMMLCTLIPFFLFPFLSKSLIMMAVYLWSRHYPNQNVSIMGLFQVPGFYFPWVLVVMSLVMGGDVVAPLLGCMVAHLFYFLDTIYPQTSGRAILTTPQWVHWLIFKWAESAPDMFPPSARVDPGTQRMHVRTPIPRPVPGATSGGGGQGAPRGGPAEAPAPQPASQAFRGRAYRLDRD